MSRDYATRAESGAAKEAWERKNNRRGRFESAKNDEDKRIQEFCTENEPIASEPYR